MTKIQHSKPYALEERVFRFEIWILEFIWNWVLVIYKNANGYGHFGKKVGTPVGP
jgi:hypothetical protein